MDVIESIGASLVASLIYSWISNKIFNMSNTKAQGSSESFKVINIIASLLVYISTLIFMFILSPVLTSRWEKMTDVGIFNAIKMSLAPYIFITIGACSLPIMYFIYKLFKFIVAKVYDNTDKSIKEIEKLGEMAEKASKSKDKDD